MFINCKYKSTVTKLTVCILQVSYCTNQKAAVNQGEIYIAACLLKARIVNPAKIAVARERL
jgi:hypothetical protein